jgi:hypothetical protein
MVKFARFMQMNWMGCMAHQLALVTSLAFFGVGLRTALKQARALVGSIKGSSKHAKLHAKLHIAVSVVIQNVTTRWWSAHAMVARLLQLKRALTQNLQRDDLLDIGLTDEQWDILAEVEKLLGPFMQVQKALEGEM